MAYYEPDNKPWLGKLWKAEASVLQCSREPKTFHIHIKYSLSSLSLSHKEHQIFSFVCHCLVPTLVTWAKPAEAVIKESTAALLCSGSPLSVLGHTFSKPINIFSGPEGTDVKLQIILCNNKSLAVVVVVVVVVLKHCVFYQGHKGTGLISIAKNWYND